MNPDSSPAWSWPAGSCAGVVEVGTHDQLTAARGTYAELLAPEAGAYA